jgi:hypothetical protein
VASFDNSPDIGQRADWSLLQNGFVTLFWNRDLFAAACRELEDEGYVVVALDTASWDSTGTALRAFGDALDFPDYFGKSIDALVDCLRDVAAFEYGSNANTTGTVIALDAYDVLNGRDGDLAWTLLDILADTGRQALLLGHRFIVIVRSSDPHITFKSVGATRVGWNRKEFLDSRRGK